ncbi:MAG: aminopeptidase [Acidobacteria bacterium]|nr:MAG: aminopeptidase [Acidobacteriota bacterium]
MKNRYYAAALGLALLLGLSTILLNSLSAVQAPGATESAVSDLSAARYLESVTYLARDEMKGRGDGSPELEQAADYIASQFRAFGLKPAGDDRTYFQKFELTTGADFGSKNELQLNGENLKVNTDFVPIAFSNTAEFEGPVVFAGYGITAPELHYDDYQGIDANAKVVVILRHEPQELDPASPFNGTNFTPHAAFINKAINAKQHGAKGIVFITDPNNHAADPDTVGDAARIDETADFGISAVQARRAPVMKLFKDAGKDLAAIQKKMDSDLKSQSFELTGRRVRIATEVHRTRKTVRNVVGVLPGTDATLQNEYVVAGAHYDHLGLGDRNSLAPSQIGQIHHGADDNASGTSGVLELARVAAKNKQSFKRSILFMTFAGEELGLLGSSYFVNHSTIPLSDITAMINMDMIGRLTNDRLFVGGVGTSPNFRAWLEDFNKSAGLKLDYSDSGFGASDHTSFNAKKIPVLFIFSGLHSDYHKPSDTYDKINAPGAVKILSLVYPMLVKAANEVERLQYTQVQEPQQPAGGGAGGYGPYFGSIPDFRDDLKGVLFSDVRPDSPAAKAGLKPGDLMVEFDGKPIQNLYDFTYALRAKKPGDVVVVVVKRNDQEVKANVTLEARR